MLAGLLALATASAFAGAAFYINASFADGRLATLLISRPPRGGLSPL